ncbi:MAG: amidase family protein, partial [Burkholderiaceae bacterium]
MKSTPLHRLSACEAQAALAQRSLRAEDLVRACLDRIAEREPQVQAWQWLAADAALARARALDSGAWKCPLHGLPIGIKDVTVTAGAVSAAQSTIGASPAAITAGGAASTITVTARDAFGNVVPGLAVTLSADGT